MKTIKSSKEITTLEVGDEVVFGDLEYTVSICPRHSHYYLNIEHHYNDEIFQVLNIHRKDFIEGLGISANYNCDFPEVKSLEALTAIVSALFKEYEKQNELPKTWEEFCERNPIICGESCICPTSEISELDVCERDSIEDKNVCTSKQEAEAFLALMQLRQLRKVYVKDWEPNWTGTSSKFCIRVDEDRIRVANSYCCQRSLAFPTSELAKQFLTNFKDLLEIAKPLL